MIIEIKISYKRKLRRLSEMEIKKLVQQFEDLMSTSFLEEGKLETLKRMVNNRHRILLVLTGMEVDMDAVNYSLNLSRRIGAGIKILYLTRDISELPYIDNSLNKLKSAGISYQIKVCNSSVKEEIVSYINNDEKETDISFVVIDSRDLGIRSLRSQKADYHDWEKLRCPLVLVSKTPKFISLKRRMVMTQNYVSMRKKPIGKMVIYGLASVAMYAALLMNQATITSLFTRGAWYALFPIATAFAISFVHGHFTGYFWSVLGVEATKKALRTGTQEQKHTEKRERPQPQPRLRAKL
jgi:hypothetical protein